MSWLEILKEHPEYSEKAKTVMSGNVYLKDTGGYLSRQAAADYIKKNQSTQQATSLKAKQEQIGRFLIDNAAEFKKARIEQGRKNVYQNRAPVFPNADGTKPSIKEASIENTVKNSGDFWENYKKGLKSADNKIEFSKAFETIDINGGTGKVSDYDAVKAMTSEQMRTYNYLLGKYGTKRANQYFENVRDANTSKINNIVDNDIRQTVKNEGIRGKGFAVGANLATGITAPIAYAESAISAATNKPIDVNSAAQRATRNASVSHDALTENMGYWGRTLTDVGLSMGKSALAMGMGALTGSPAAATVIMGLDAAAAKTYENAQKGVSARRNFADATLTGIAEGFFEKFSIGNFMKMSGIAKTGIKDIAVQLLKQAGVEASEEAATEIADNLIDFFILGNKSDVKQYYNDLLEQGESKSAAAAKTLWQYGAVNPAQSALGGAISGAGFGMVGATGGYINTKNEGARLNMTGEAGELINSASDGRYGDRAAKMAQDIQLNRLDGKQAKDIDVGNLQRAAAEYLQNQKEEAKKNAARAKRAETMENIRTRAADFADGVHNAAVNFSDGVYNAGAKAADSVRNVFRMRGEDGAENTNSANTETSITGNADMEQSEPRFRMRRMYDDTLDEGQKKVFEREAQGGGKYNATATAQTEEQTRAQTTAQKFGHRVVFYEGSDNGFIKDGTVYISKDAENPVMSVLGHELTHAVMADESIKKELVNFVRAQIISEDGALKGDYSDRFNKKKRLYQSRMENVTDDYILEEITADIGGDLFMSDEFINRITEEKPNIAVRIWRSIKDFIARVTGNGRYKDLSGSEIKQLRDAAKAAQKYEQAFIKARENMTSGNSESKYMFAGKNAATADLSALATAEKMEQSGSTPEEIWTETGWSKGQDGKWRFEIDDSNFKIKADNLAEIHRNYKEIAQKENLIYRLENMSEQERKNRELGFTLLGLDEKYKTVDDEISKLKQDISELSKDKKMEIINGAIGYDLSDLVEGYALFEAYPDLKNVQVLISNSNELGKDNRGEWNRKNNTICLNGDYSVEDIESTLLHEIQHAIQSKEGFARGATPEYWQSKIYNVYNDKQFNKDAKTLYKNTAGEIEARDVQTRRNMTAEERRNTFPESMKKRDDAVFADDSVYSSDYVGKNKYGIEVYETSDDVKKLSYQERMQRFVDIMENQYSGRTAKFTRNGHTYYARFEAGDIRKNVYGDKRSDKKGWRSKINVGADGNVFELVENATYERSEAEKGKSTKAHKNIKYWDYFIKTVQIDNKVFDLVANVRKTTDNQYVYSLQLNENKKTIASPPLGTENSSLNRVLNATVNNSITENGGNVKHSLKENSDDAQIHSDNFKAWFGDWENDPKNASKVVNEDGTPKVVYHGTSENFTVFDITKSRSYDETPDYDLPGFYFSESTDESGSYGDNLGEYYINIRNPYSGDTYELRKELGSYRKVYDYLVEQGYDGIIDDEMGEGFTEYIVFKPNQIKSATDNIGTFDKNNADIRYKLSSSQKAARFNSIADKLITETGTTLERGEVSAALEDIYNTLSASDYSAAAYTQALEDLKSLSRSAFENTGTVKDDTLYKENADLRRYLRTTAIAVNDSAKEDFGSKKDFNDFRRANFGRIRISNSGTPVDIIYKELSELYPQFFDENREMTQSDQLKRIAEVLRSIQPTVRSTYEGADIDALADSTADELFSSMLGVVGENAETDEKKKKVSRFRTNTIERAVMFSEEDLKNISPEEFEYIPETVKEWNEQAVKNVSDDMEGVMEKIRASENIPFGGVMAHEAALISNALTDGYHSTGSAADLAAMTDWFKVVSERTREAARFLKATDSAWEKSPAAAIAKAQSVVQEEQDKKENPKSKKAKERKSTSKKHADEVNSIQDSGVERIADEVEKAFGEKTDSASEQEHRTRTTKRQRIESRTLEKFNITKEKEPNKAAFVSKVLSDLFGKISKTRKGADSGAKYSAAEQPKLDLWYSDIKAAIEGRGEYAEVWEEMYALAREEFAGDAKALSAIDDYFTNGKKPIVPLDALDKAINDAFSGIGTNIGQVVRDYFSDDNQTAAALSDYIIEKTGVGGEDADELAKYVKERYREIVKDKQIKYLEREAVKLDKPRLVSTETIKRVSRHIDSVFSEEQLKEFERDALNRVNPRIAEYVRENGINLLDVAKHGVCDSELDNYKYLDGLLKELDGRITEKDIKDFSEAVYREFAKMPPVRNDKVLSRYFKIDKGGMIVTETIRPRTILGDMLGLIDIAGKKRAGLVEEILKRNDGLVTLEQSDINAILNHMSAAADLDKDSREYKVEIARVKKIIEGKKQPTLSDGIKAYARINMLLNPKTILTRNFGGNLLQAGIYNIENTISTGIDKVISKKTGIRTSAAPTINNLKEQGKGFVKGAQDAWKDYKEGVDTRDFDGRYDIGEGDPFTNKNAIGRGFNKVNRLTGAILDMGDRPFYEMHYNSVLEQLKRANNVSEATEEMIEIAREVALERTWQDENDFTKTAAGAKRLLNRIHLPGINYGAGDIVEPFVKTPANLFRATLKYSPAGLGKSLLSDSYKLMKAHKDGTLTMKMQRKYVDDLSKAIVGTLITIIGYAIAKKGMFNGEDADDDKVQKFREYVEGIMPNSLKIGDYSVSLSWLQPMGAPLSFGATFENEMKKDNSFGSKLINAFANSMENVINASFIQGIRELLAGNYKTMFDKFLDAGKDGIIQMLPFGSLAKQAANSIDNTVRSTYAPTDKDKFFNRAKQYYPGLSNTLEPRLNALGEQSQRTYDETPDRVSLADGAARVLNSFFNPANTRRISSTPLIKELNRVYDMTGDSSVYPSEAENKVTVDGKDYRLTSEQYTVYQRKVGTKFKEVLNALIVDDEKAGKYAGEKKDEVTVTYAKMTEEERKKKESSIKTKAAAEYKESIDKKNVKINDLSLDERTELKRQQKEAVERFRNGEEQTNNVVWSDVPYSQLDDGQKAEVLSSAIKKAREAVKEELKEDWTKNAQPVFKMKG